MVNISDINSIFARITEQYSEPIPIGGRCESHVYYRTEELSEEELDACAYYVADRIEKVTSPQTPELLLKLPGGYSFFAERLAYACRQDFGIEAVVEAYNEKKLHNGLGELYHQRCAVLVTDVITTARSSLEAHTKTTLRGIPVLCWATLIDRTFGPGPVPVVSAFTGAPVRLLTRIA